MVRKKTDTLTAHDAERLALGMTAENYDHAGKILARLFVGLTFVEAKAIRDHIGRFAEKKYPQWPAWPNDWPW